MPAQFSKLRMWIVSVEMSMRDNVCIEACMGWKVKKILLESMAGQRRKIISIPVSGL